MKITNDSSDIDYAEILSIGLCICLILIGFGGCVKLAGGCWEPPKDKDAEVNHRAAL